MIDLRDLTVKVNYLRDGALHADADIKLLGPEGAHRALGERVIALIDNLNPETRDYIVCAYIEGYLLKMLNPNL
jgi:hypothetical protein